VTSFVHEVRLAFAAVAADYALALLDASTPLSTEGVAYAGAGVEYLVLHDPHDRVVLTHVALVAARPRLHAELTELVVAAGLGAAQHVRVSGRTRHAVAMSVRSQAEWVRRLHPVLAGPDGPDLIRAARGR